MATVPSGTAIFTYDAGGNKLRKVAVISGITKATDYIGGAQYSNGGLDFMPTEEGRAVNISGIYHYEYYLSDHLGNMRVAFQTQKGTADTVQKDDYYAFGMEINKSINGTKNECQFCCL